MPSHFFVSVLAVILSVAKDPDAAHVTETARFFPLISPVHGEKVRAPLPVRSPSGSFDFVRRKRPTDSAQDDGT
jgi:hypothetical protein